MSAKCYAGEGAIHWPRGRVSGRARHRSRCGEHAGGGVRRADRQHQFLSFVVWFVVWFVVVDFESVTRIRGKYVINGSDVVNKFVGPSGWLLVRFDVGGCAESR